MTVAHRVADGVRPVNPIKLICLAHAGGNVSLYRDWPRRLSPFVRLQPLELPGRGARRAAPAHTEWPALIAQLADETLELVQPGESFAVFGHSMGALVGLELIHALRRRAGRAPVWFGASGVVSPARRALETHWLGCLHDEMVARLRERGGTPAALLDDRDFVDLMLPVLRADFHLCGVHPAHLAMRAAGPAHAPLDCPIDVFIGRADPATANGDDVAAWAADTRGTCTVHRFDGGHFFIDETPGPVLDTVEHALGRACNASHAAVSTVAAQPVKEPAWIR